MYPQVVALLDRIQANPLQRMSTKVPSPWASPNSRNNHNLLLSTNSLQYLKWSKPRLPARRLREAVSSDTQVHRGVVAAVVVLQEGPEEEGDSVVQEEEAQWVQA